MTKKNHVRVLLFIYFQDELVCLLNQRKTKQNFDFIKFYLHCPIIPFGSLWNPFSLVAKSLNAVVSIKIAELS